MLIEDFEVAPSEVDETWPGGSPAEAVTALALRKLPEGNALAADTIVWDGEPLGKPADALEAETLLRRLDDRWHEVWTGVAVRRGEVKTTAVRTQVHFQLGAALPDYVASGAWHGKAGGYGLQDPMIAARAELRGSWSNVVGLPLAETAALLGVAAPDESGWLHDPPC